MTHKKHSLFLLFFYFFITSCSEIIDMDLNDAENNRLVVEGTITTERKTHWIKLSRTSDYFVNQPTNAELNAQISVSTEDTTFYYTDPDNDGVYVTDKELSAKAGKTYTLNIQLSNGEQYSAESYMKAIYPMDSISYSYAKSNIPVEEGYFYLINIFVQEPESVGDYYLWEVFINDVLESDTLRKKTFVSDEFVNGSYIADWPVYEIEEAKITKDTTVIKLQMLSISKAEYEFKLAVLLETDFSGAGFNGPPANIPSNISNGALGFFGASAVTEDSLVIIKHNKKRD